MKINLRFFASVREALGSAGETVDLPAGVATVGAVRDFLIARGGAWADGLIDNPPGQAIAKGDIVRFISFSALQY